MWVDEPAASGGHPFERSPDQDYFQTLEREIIAMRGAPLYLSPDDFGVSREWRREGIPVDLVLEAVREVIEKKKAAEKEVPIRLGYYRRAVARAWEERRRLTAPAAPASDQGLDAGKRLRALAEALPSATWSRPFAVRLEALVGAGLAAPETETRLVELDGELLAAARLALSPEGVESLEEKISASLAMLEGRLAAAEIERSRSRLAEQILRREWGLPTLSLFGPEAAAADREDTENG